MDLRDAFAHCHGTLVCGFRYDREGTDVIARCDVCRPGEAIARGQLNPQPGAQSEFMAEPIKPPIIYGRGF
jgi:hypothetical protein